MYLAVADVYLYLKKCQACLLPTYLELNTIPATRSLFGSKTLSNSSKYPRIEPQPRSLSCFIVIYKFPDCDLLDPTVYNMFFIVVYFTIVHRTPGVDS